MTPAYGCGSDAITIASMPARTAGGRLDLAAACSGSDGAVGSTTGSTCPGSGFSWGKQVSGSGLNWGFIIGFNHLRNPMAPLHAPLSPEVPLWLLGRLPLFETLPLDKSSRLYHPPDRLLSLDGSLGLKQAKCDRIINAG